jgi:HEAT repeat protein
MATGGVSAHVVALSEGVIKAMFLTKIKIVSAVVLTGGLLTIGVANVASRGARAEPPAVVAPPRVESNSKTPEVVFRALAKKAAGLGLDIEFAGHTAMEIVKTTKEPDAKWRAVRILGSLRYEPAVPLLLESLSDPHHGVRANAARALGDMKVAAASKPLTELLKTEADGGVIQQTSLALANLRYSQALPALKAAAKHEDEQTRMWVLQAVGRLGGKRDVPFLAGYLLDDPSSSVQMSAAKAIEQITGADFGFPKRGGIYSPDAGLRQAETWWKEHKGEFRD